MIHQVKGLLKEGCLQDTLDQLAWNGVDGNRWNYRSFHLPFPSQAALALTDAVKGAVQLGAHVCTCAELIIG